MKLSTKLLLGVGLLLCGMVVLTYILPACFVKQDVYAAAEHIHSLLIKEHRKLVESQKHSLNAEIDRTVQNINSILFMLGEENSFSNHLLLKEENPLLNVWKGAADLAGYDPEIGFVQIHSPDQNQTIVISSHNAKLYTIKKVWEGNGWVVMSMDKAHEEEMLYLGIPLPKAPQDENTATSYALIEINKILWGKENFSQMLASLVLHQDQNMPQEIFSEPKDDPEAYFWGIKIDMIRKLAPLFLEGLSIQKDQEKVIPDGIGRLDLNNEGVALFAKEVFQTTPVSHDLFYDQMYSSKRDQSIVADSSIFIVQPEENSAFIANTLFIPNTFISIGFSMSNLIKGLSLSWNQTILLNIDQKIWLGFDGKGKKLTSSEIDKILQSNSLKENEGMLSIEGQSSFNSCIKLFNEDLVLYAIDPITEEKSIIETLLELEHTLSRRISLQLALISLAIMLLILLFVGRIGFTVIYPITKLAKATEDVVAGNYQEIVFPNLGKRSDEVAILIRSFVNMVKGLEEKEKIRGILDKVVSKEVANEILRDRIHLGGEDRIVTMLFSDIRGFTEMTENATPQKIIKMLNACMTKISRVIEGEGGVIDKYVGDEIMAIYGAPKFHEDHALRAVSTGMLMIETLKQWNEERAKEGEPVIEMGIGIHTGCVVAGNMGAENRLNYTVLGSNVNLASRLCQVAKGNQLVISKATLIEPNVKESFFVEPLEAIALKGFKEPVSIYEVVRFKWEES
ncbi:MAG: adenylate/guanylate cyclase domain-containing protein [Chlamydiales bacterium]